MAKDKINDYDSVPDSNTDIGNISIVGGAPVLNFDNALRTLMSHLKELASGTSPILDTTSVCDPTDTTKIARLDAGNVPTATTRALDAEALYRSGAPTETIYTSSGTHTFSTKTRYFRVEAVGGGGGGGGVIGSGVGTMAAGGGGGSGFCGKTTVLSRGSLTTATVVIGPAGAGGSGNADGTSGGNTTWADGTNSFTWGGGGGGDGRAAASTGVAGFPGIPGNGSGTLRGGAMAGRQGYIGGPAFDYRVGGAGASSAFGSGGTMVASPASNGVAAAGYGSGGSGAVVGDLSTSWVGGAGTAGLLIVREW